MKEMRHFWKTKQSVSINTKPNIRSTFWKL